MATTRRPKASKSGASPIRLGDDAVLLRNMVEHAAIPTFLATVTGELVYANAAFCALLGYDPKECISLSLIKIVHPDDLATARSQIAGVLNGTVLGYSAERRFVRKDGIILRVLVSASLVSGVSDSPPYLSIQAIDIDRQKRAEEAVAESESRWNFALESAGQGVWDHDFRTKRQFFSPMWWTMRGLDPKSDAGQEQKAWMARVHPDDIEAVLADGGDEGPGNGEVTITEYRERHKDGHWIWILSRGKAIAWFPDGKPARIMGTDTDITGIKNAEKGLQFANTLLTTAMETSPDGILVVDGKSRIVSFNRRFGDMWGVPADALSAGDDSPVLGAVTSAMRDPKAFVARVQYLYQHPEEEGHDELETKDGRIIDRHTGVLNAVDGTYLGRVWFFRDITTRRRLERELTDSRNLLSSALAQMADGLAMFDSEGRLVFCNEQYRSFFPRTADVRVPGTDFRTILRAVIERGEQLGTPQEQGEAWIEMIAASLHVHGEEEVHLFDGRWLHIRTRPSTDISSMVVVSDITKIKLAETELFAMTKQLKRLATTDGLTGLMNRRAFDQTFEAELARGSRNKTAISLLLVDIDRFKAYNDLYGHLAGDECLRVVSRCFRQIAKRPGDFVARYGGEEFVVVLADTTEEGASRIAEAFRKSLRKQALQHEGCEAGFVSVSIGIATYRAGDRPRLPDELLSRADEALYAAKAQGRDRVVGWSAGLGTEVRSRGA